MSSRGKIIAVGALLAVGGLAAGGYFFWRQPHDAVRLALPPPPDVSSWPDEFQRALASARGTSFSALAKLSRLYHANGFLAEAAACYDALERAQPQEPRWLHRHATIDAGFGQAAPAIERWRRVLQLSPDYLPARLRLAELLAKTEHTAEATQAYQAILERKPDEPYAQLGMARIDLDAGRWENARQRLEAVTRLTGFELGYDLLVTVYEHFGQQDRATSIRGRSKASGTFHDPQDPWMDELLEDCFDAYRLSLTAGTLSRRGDRTNALRLLERAVSLAPNDVAVRFQLATLHVERLDSAQARAQLERCTSLAPNFPDAWAHLASLRQRENDARGAEQAILTGLRHNPQSPGLHLMRARQLREAGRNTEAVDAYRNSIRFRPNEADAWLELATTFFRLERVAEGLAALNQAVVNEPNHPMALALLAFHAISQRDEPSAKKWLTAVQNQPRVPREQAKQLLAGYREQFGKDFP